MNKTKSTNKSLRIEFVLFVIILIITVTAIALKSGSERATGMTEVFGMDEVTELG